MNNVVAERKLIVELKTGERRPVTIRIGQPYETGEEDWACPLSLEGLYERLFDACGIDSFQALMLAQNLIKSLLNAVVRDGGKLFSVFEAEDDDAAEVDLDAMFVRGL